MVQLEKIIPPQVSGGHTGATEKVETTYRTNAILVFNAAKKRLFDINNWHKLCGKASALFQLTDSNGNLLYKSIPDVGNLIRIELPGAPPNTTGGGYDWVRIEEIEDQKDIIKDEEIAGFRVRPVSNPLTKDNEAAHFYTHEATSTFLVIRNKYTVVALERGRNEKSNTKPGSLLNKIRNVGIAFAAMLGLSTPQWKSLVRGVLKG